MMKLSKAVLLLFCAAGFLIGCGSDGSETETAEPSGAETSETSEPAETSETSEASEDSDVAQPTVAVTANILGDVVTQLVGSQAEVYTVMPAGADPHDFSPSAQEVSALLAADALITNGGGFEEGLLDVVEQAEDEGIPVFEALDAVSTLEADDSHDHAHEDDHKDEDEHADEDDHAHEDEHEDGDDHAHEDGDEHEDGHEDGDDHADEDDHAHEDEHDHGDTDPHFFTDPNRMAEAVGTLADFLKSELPALDADELDASRDAYLAELEALDGEIVQALSVIPEDRRILVTNHNVLSYFADAYDFEVVGVVVPGLSTSDAVSAADLSELLEVIEAEQVPAIFVDSSSASDLADTVASDVEGLQIVELYTESLGASGSEGETYIEMLSTNASRMGAALG